MVGAFECGRSAQRMQAWTARSSEQSRYVRFMQHLAELTPRLVQQFTNIDDTTRRSRRCEARDHHSRPRVGLNSGLRWRSGTLSAGEGRFVRARSCGGIGNAARLELCRAADNPIGMHGGSLSHACPMTGLGEDGGEA